MTAKVKSAIVDVLQRFEEELLTEWLNELQRGGIQRDDLMKESELRRQCGQLLEQLRAAAESGNMADISRPEWQPVREMLVRISASRANQGFTPSQTASFVLALKKPMFDRLSTECGKDTALLSQEVWKTTQLIDALSLATMDAFQKTREQIILRQQQEMMELSTPVVKLWDGVLALPMIGTLDSARTQVVMETLLQRIVDTEAEIAIIDITGVPTVDTLVAQHLIKTVTAARLMGADCIISGIRPQIAQTIVHLGVNLADITTKATLADAFAIALRRRGSSISRTSPSNP